MPVPKLRMGEAAAARTRNDELSVRLAGWQQQLDELARRPQNRTTQIVHRLIQDRIADARRRS